MNSMVVTQTCHNPSPNNGLNGQICRCDLKNPKKTRRSDPKKLKNLKKQAATIVKNPYVVRSISHLEVTHLAVSTLFSGPVNRKSLLSYRQKNRLVTLSTNRKDSQFQCNRLRLISVRNRGDT